MARAHEFNFQKNATRAGARKAMSVLKSIGYTQEILTQVMGPNPARFVNAHEYEMALERTRDGSALSTLIRLFLLKQSVKLSVAQKSLKKDSLKALSAVGLLSIKNGTCRPDFKLTPIQDWILASDFQAFEGRPEKVKNDYVMGIGASTRFLAGFTVRRPVNATLDLGTGCGTLAFLASAHSKRIATTDFNDRAVQVTAYNAWLNGVDVFDYYQGDLFQPVAGQKFGLIVSSPPYVISPESRYLFRDGEGGNNLCRRLVQGAPEHLVEGGFCQFLCNWPHHGDDGVAYLKAWFKNCCCDVWVLRCFTQDVAEYGAEWLRHTEPDSQAHVSKHYKRWMNFYRSEGITKISGAIIAMRKRSGKGYWFHIDNNEPAAGGVCGEQVALLMENRATLNELSDRELASRNWQLAPDTVCSEVSLLGKRSFPAELYRALGLGQRVQCAADLLHKIRTQSDSKKPGKISALTQEKSSNLKTVKELAHWGLIKLG